MLDLQRRDGAWPAFVGDSEASWTTALALCALNGTGEFTSAREKAFHCEFPASVRDCGSQKLIRYAKGRRPERRGTGIGSAS